MSSTKKGMLCVLAAAVLWGSSGVCAQFIMEKSAISAQWLTMTRLLFTGVILLTLSFVHGDKIFTILKNRRDALSLLFFSLFGAMVVQLSFLVTIEKSNAATATVLQFLSPTIIVAWFALVRKARPTLLVSAAIMTSLIGTFLLVTHGNITSLSISSGALVWSNYIEEIDGKRCKGCIELSDNGCGMDLATIVNGWLTLSNSPKKKMKKEQKTTPKYHRYPLGDKGLGRLSVQKLGRYMQMMTKAADSDIEYRVVIPWGDFLKNTTIDQIPVTITKQEITSQKSYTKIIIKDIINPEMW